MYRPLQPQFKIRVFTDKAINSQLKGSGAINSSGNNYIDIETCVAYPVTYEETADMLNKLRFTVDKYADVLLFYFDLGTTVALFGGFYSDNQDTVREVFKGEVTRIRTSFADNGHISFEIECLCDGFVKLGKDPKNFVYPDKNSTRNFAKTESMTLEDLIRGILKDNNYEVGQIDLPAEARNATFSKLNISAQKNESDWKFLKRLAMEYGSTVWISVENGVEKFNFMSKEKALKNQKTDIAFVYPLYGVTNKNLRWDPTIRDEEKQVFNGCPEYTRPRLLRNVMVEEDVHSATSVTRSSMYFDKETGEYKQSISQIVDKNGKNYIVFYELDEARVEYIRESNPELADNLMHNGATALPWGVPGDNNPNHSNYYYKATKIYDEQTAVFDGALEGITVSATCNQDLDIRSQRSYNIRGILRYRTESVEESFYLRGLKHVWAADGTWTELDFIR